MNGDVLALGTVAALAAAGLVRRRGSRDVESLDRQFQAWVRRFRAEGWTDPVANEAVRLGAEIGRVERQLRHANAENDSVYHAVKRLKERTDAYWLGREQR